MNTDRMRKLARALDALADRDRREVERRQAIEAIRRAAAQELHATCLNFISQMNQYLGSVRIELSPADYAPAYFHEDTPNLFQLNVNGRLIQITFQSTGPLTSTDRYRVPYTLEGFVNYFNQDLLDDDEVRDHRLFYCLEKSGNHWRFHDPRGNRHGLVDEDYLAMLLEKLT